MANRLRPTSTPSTPRTRAEQRAEEREFWDRDLTTGDLGGEKPKAAFAESVTGARRWLRSRRRP